MLLGQAITVHKSQGSTLNYIKGHLGRSTGKKTATGKTYQKPISQGQFYSLLSRAKSHDKVLVSNFDPEQIKVNESALKEMVRMTQEYVFSWQHPLKTFSGTSICLLNIRVWNAHLEHFVSDNIYQSCSRLLCFTETNFMIVRLNILMKSWMI